jgi:hypothetical protein
MSEAKKPKFIKVKMLKSIVWEGKIIPASVMEDKERGIKAKDVIVTLPSWYASALLSERRAVEIKDNKADTIKVNQKADEAIKEAKAEMEALAKAKAIKVNEANIALNAAKADLAKAKPEQEKQAKEKVDIAQKALNEAIVELSK